jgi:hypothetical protein
MVPEYDDRYQAVTQSGATTAEPKGIASTKCVEFDTDKCAQTIHLQELRVSFVSRVGWLWQITDRDTHDAGCMMRELQKAPTSV